VHSRGLVLLPVLRMTCFCVMGHIQWLSGSDHQRATNHTCLSVINSTRTQPAANNLIGWHGMGGSGRSGTWVEGSPGASFWFYLREALQSQTNTENIQQESLGTCML